jgi:eukaryotic-like serine/threonine-protein kinase
VRDESKFVVRGRWACRSLIAAGTSSTVWRGHDRQLDRPVAVRIFDPDQLRRPQDRRRAEELIRVAARLEHDNVACLYDAFDDDDLGLVLIGELVDGPTLRELCDRLAPLPGEVVAAVGLQLAHGAAAIESASVAHRDLTPDNVRITHDGTLKILGLGTARPSADTATTPADDTADDLAYLAPEQLADGTGDHRSDVYTIGLLLWELAVGARPFEIDGPGRAAIIRMRMDVPPLRTVRPRIRKRLSQAVESATRCDPRQRLQHADRLAAALRRECRDRPQRVLRHAAAQLLPPRPTPVRSLEGPAISEDAASAAPPTSKDQVRP